MTKHILITALLASILGGVATYAAGAALQTVETEVRINAQRLDDGRVEFALQQRNEDGAWGERQLPTRRFFPASGFVNRWANSTPITVVGEIEVVDLYVNDTQPTRTLSSVDEYVEYCSNPDPQVEEDIAAAAGAFDSDSETAVWDDLFAVFDAWLSHVRSIDPPPELDDYHQAQIRALTLMTQFVYLKSPDETFDVWEYLILFAVGSQPLAEAEANLDADLRNRLSEAGCLNDASTGSAP